MSCIESLDLTIFQLDLYDELSNSLMNIFKANNNDFISYPDQQLVKAYIGRLVNVLGDGRDLFNDPKELLEKKLGALFVKWSDEWEDANLKSSICKRLFK